MQVIRYIIPTNGKVKFFVWDGKEFYRSKKGKPTGKPIVRCLLTEALQRLVRQ